MNSDWKYTYENLAQNYSLVKLSFQHNQLEHKYLLDLKRLCNRNMEILLRDGPEKMEKVVWRLEFESSKLTGAKEQLECLSKKR